MELEQNLASHISGLDSAWVVLLITEAGKGGGGQVFHMDKRDKSWQMCCVQGSMGHPELSKR